MKLRGRRNTEKQVAQHLGRASAVISCLVMTVTSAIVWGKDPAASSLPLEGARFGMTIDAWKALSVPSGVGTTASPVCWSSGTAISVPGYKLSAEDKRTDLTTCAYVSRFGNVVLPHSVPFDASFQADGLRFLFNKGRLAEVEFRTSVDAYSDVTALITRRFGPPTDTVRDTVKTSLGKEVRLRQTWRVGGGKVFLVDPSPNPTELGVDLALSASRGA